MDPCSLPTATTNTSIVQAVSATRAAQRGNHRSSRATEETASAAGSSLTNETVLPEQQQRSQTRSPRLLDGELQGPPPHIPLTDMLPMMQLPLYRHHRNERPAPPLRRLLTNEDLIATIDEVLELVGEDVNPMPNGASNQDPRRNLSHQPLHQ